MLPSGPRREQSQRTSCVNLPRATLQNSRSVRACGFFVLGSCRSSFPRCENSRSFCICHLVRDPPRYPTPSTFSFIMTLCQRVTQASSTRKVCANTTVPSWRPARPRPGFNSTATANRAGCCCHVRTYVRTYVRDVRNVMSITMHARTRKALHCTTTN